MYLLKPGTSQNNPKRAKTTRNQEKRAETSQIDPKAAETTQEKLQNDPKF